MAQLTIVPRSTGKELVREVSIHVVATRDEEEPDARLVLCGDCEELDEGVTLHLNEDEMRLVCDALGIDGIAWKGECDAE